ncbi:putative homoserine dehydrogenase-like protein [Keratinibaculum paraultunense]|uniref:Putative homoserine dehydrogenase-like protein n=2 Tax=Keratinibaculum paraultunense TaxID=1278232 RepID=A0A4R3KSE4_9FIRM|nr:SAF domain-containing protein [Keratinibaculum paraultunense]QQY79460.1 NAD(P)-dependent oxidoreductase [Keratinibaculum paraultunense]TCS88046.1 putative homoserine dehydrogenase-like protein [Keratinibaculum paraultunense]
MSSMNKRLIKLANEKNSIKVAIVGAGKMGKGLVNQMTRIKGMVPALVINRNVKKALYALLSAGIREDDIIVSNSLKDINFALERGKYAVSEYMDLAAKAYGIQAVVDATGVPEVGAKLSLDAIENKKHIIMLNVEADSVVGPILYKQAQEAGVIYTGTAGDEPGAVMELYDFAVGLGFEVLVIGKGKNNPIDLDANPDTVYEEALRKDLKPHMLAAFIDGTNTMIEMTCMANATGFVPDVSGGHGVESNIDNLTNIFKLKEEGGILNKYKIVDYVRGIAPGVFLIFTTNLEEIHKQLEYLNMGPGPNYVLYRPYHLTSLETPNTIYEACVNNRATIAPTEGVIADTVTVAKRDLKAGERLDRIGGYTVYGSIEEHEIAKKENLVPIGLIDENTKVLKDIKKGEFITYDMIELDTSKSIYKLRKLQEEQIG